MKRDPIFRIETVAVRWNPMFAEIAGAFDTFAPGLSALVAAGTLIQVLYEYIKQNKFRRFEKFQEMSARFDDNDSIQKVCELLLTGTPGNPPLSKQTKEVFICFIEEIAMLQNSGYVNKYICAYTFGHYATLALKQDAFWEGLSRKDYYYALFVKFCEGCRDIEQSRSAEDNWTLAV